jgi:hypothetical protein
MADLAITALPKRLIRPPFTRLTHESLPPLADYQVVLVRRAGRDNASDVLAEHITQGFRER